MQKTIVQELFRLLQIIQITGKNAGIVLGNQKLPAAPAVRMINAHHITGGGEKPPGGTLLNIGQAPGIMSDPAGLSHGIGAVHRDPKLPEPP